jgi:hypothetical protein
VLGQGSPNFLVQGVDLERPVPRANREYGYYVRIRAFHGIDVHPRLKVATPGRVPPGLTVRD